MTNNKTQGKEVNNINRSISGFSLPAVSSLNSLQSFQIGVKVSRAIKTLRYNRMLINSINLN